MIRPFAFISAAFFLLLLFYASAHVWEYDEAWTYVSVKNESLFDLLAYKHFNIANNHLLNSLWFKLMQAAGARHVLLYRAASLLSFPVFCYFLYKTATYNAPWWTPGNDWYLCLFLLPPMIVYFAAGRGYAMATASFIGALYYLKVYLAEKKQAAYWKFFLLGVFSCLSIVSFLYPFAAMLLYILLRSGDTLFSRKNIISAILLLPLVLYIYHIGRTILLHDTIINGTDNLVVNGMYSTFLATLTVYQAIFPFPVVFTWINLESVTKVLVLLTFIPVAWLLIRRYKAINAEFIILLISTALFLLSHLLVKTKYPSDRSVLFLLYLLYIPLIRYTIKSKNSFFRIHYFTVFLFCLINFIGFFYILSKPTIYSIVRQNPEKTYTIYSDWPNWADDVYNELYFGERVHFHYLARSFDKDPASVDEKLKGAASDAGADFILLQKSTYQRNKSLFGNNYQVQTIMSSNYKELYLLSK